MIFKEILNFYLSKKLKNLIKNEFSKAIKKCFVLNFLKNMFLYYIKTYKKIFYLPKKRLLNFLRSLQKILESNLHMLKHFINFNPS